MRTIIYTRFQQFAPTAYIWTITVNYILHHLLDNRMF